MSIIFQEVIIMAELKSYTKEQLLDFKAALEKEYEAYKAQNLKIRGRCGL